jgi:hypothetical protein
VEEVSEQSSDKINIMKKLLLLLTIFISLSTLAQNVYLQAVSIDPVSPIINKGEPVSVLAIFRNNGPGAIPPGEASCHITFSNTYLSLPRNKGVIESIHWQIVSIKRNVKGQVQIFFRNTTAMNPGDDGSCIFYVRGKKYTDAAGSIITLASTLSAKSQCGDVNGSNQSVSTYVIVARK